MSSTALAPAPVKDLLPSFQDTVRNLEKQYLAGKLNTMAPLLSFLSIKGKPYTLADHYLFEPLFSTLLARKFLLKTARQVGKSSNSMASELLRSVVIPNFSSLIMTPRFEQVKRLSSNVMRPLISGSPIKGLLVNADCTQAVLQRTFYNDSIQYYSFALIDPDRVRGIPADSLFIDEIQDFNFSFLPVVEQTLGGSKIYRLTRYAGTPKTLENTIEQLWLDSSMAEPAIKCYACNYWNVACTDQDLLKMIGKTTTICAKCGRKINARNVVYEHRHPERRASFAGYHIAQPIHPYYFEVPNNWVELLRCIKDYDEARLYNECFGESRDTSTRLVSLYDIQRVCLPNIHHTMEEGQRRRRMYRLVSMGVDWGGSGEKGASFTHITITGIRPGTDITDLLYASRLSKNYSVYEEIRYIMELWRRFQPNLFCHDYTGAGNLREVLMIQAGLPRERIVPFSYTIHSDKNVIVYNPSHKEMGTRSSYSMDKPRSLVVLCTLIKARKIFFPSYKEILPYASDLLNLVETKQERPRGSDIYLIDKVANKPDDFAHALNFGCSGMWHMQQHYPSLAEAEAIRVSAEELARINPDNPTLQDWTQITASDNFDGGDQKRSTP